MSELSNFEEVASEIEEGVSGSDTKYNEVGRAASTLCDINQIASQVTNMTVVRNNNGDVIGYDYVYTGPDKPDTTAMGVDSNADGGSFGTATGGGGHTSGGGAGRYRSSTYAGEIIDPDTSQYQDKLYSKGLVSSNISPAWAMVSALSKFGKDVAGEALDAIDTAATNFTNAFSSMLVKTTNNVTDSIRALFGIQDNEVTMYLDEDTIGALAIQARDDGLLVTNSGGEIHTYTTPLSNYIEPPLKFVKLEFVRYENTYISQPLMRYDNNGNNIYEYYARVNNVFDGMPVYNAVFYRHPSTGYIRILLPWSNSSTGLNTVYYCRRTYNKSTASWNTGYSDLRVGYSLATYNNKTVAVCSTNTDNATYYQPQIPVNDVLIDNSIIDTYASWETIYGIQGGGSDIPGISDQSASTGIVDAVTGADPHVVANNLYSQYPSVMGSPKTIVVMDDSCNMVEKKYYTIPISYSPTNLNITAPITGGTQINPQISVDDPSSYPDIDMDNFIDQIIKVITGSGAGRDVTTEPDDGELTPSKDISGEAPVIIPPTGTGVTPESTLPSTIPTAFWHVYNPSTADITALAQWLWAGAFNIENFRKIFNNPMDAIIGIHAIYGEPHVTTAANIVCGNITSPTAALVVSSQYTSVDCGSVWLTEYYGNVFDYAPYTEVSLFLPFIGIVSLDVSDVMRSQLSITYNIDVFTGACNAQVSVIRDGVGGVLYQFGGNCAVSYPISGSSYNNIISGIIGVGVSAAAAYLGVAPHRAIGTALTSVTAAATPTVSRSGAFSANVGAMGSKLPYLIITRPIPEVAIGFEKYDGLPANNQIRLSECHGYTRCKECHLNIPGAFKSELDEINRLLHEGVILP